MQYLHESAELASKHGIRELGAGGGTGGVIALDNGGNGESSVLIPPYVDFLTCFKISDVLTELARNVSRIHPRRRYCKDRHLLR